MPPSSPTFLETGLLLALVCLGSYLIGAIPFGFLIGQAKGIDIRTCGSGNVGATNVTRVLGKTWGRLCFCGDFLKGAIPVLVISFLTPKAVIPGLVEALPESLRELSGCLPDRLGILPSLGGFAAVCGHIWPVYLGFRGGKGVSTAAGAIFALNPLSLIAAAAVWTGVFFAGRYVSLASVVAASSLPCFGYLFGRLRLAHASKPELLLFALLALLTIIKHSSNIKRLCKGTENRFSKPPKKDVKS